MTSETERIRGLVSISADEPLPTMGLVGPWSVYRMCSLFIPRDVREHNAYASHDGSPESVVEYDDVETCRGGDWLYFFDDEAGLTKLAHAAVVFDLADRDNKTTPMWRFRIACHQVVNFFSGEAWHRWGDKNGVIALNVPVGGLPSLDKRLKATRKRSEEIWCRVALAPDSRMVRAADGEFVGLVDFEFYEDEKQATKPLMVGYAPAGDTKTWEGTLGKSGTDEEKLASPSRYEAWCRLARLTDLEAARAEIALPFDDHIADLMVTRDRATRELDDEIDVIVLAIKKCVLALGESVKGAKRHAVYSKGRTTWDSALLKGYAIANPEVLEMRKIGRPSVSIRKVK